MHLFPGFVGRNPPERQKFLSAHKSKVLRNLQQNLGTATQAVNYRSILMGRF
jgi:hypothetical protein